MSTLRFVRELSILMSAVFGATLGYCAGSQFADSGQLICAFVGMGAGSAFADFCLRGGK